MHPPALVLIDIQQGFNDPVWGQRNQPAFEHRVRDLLAHWRERSWPVLHIQHSSRRADSTLRPNQPGHGFMAVAQPQGDEPVIDKNVNSAFIGTDLEARLRRMDIHTVVFAGLCTDHCVSTTTRMAANLGFEAYVSSDATATFPRARADGRQLSAELVHEVNLASLNGEFARVQTTEELIQELSSQTRKESVS